MALKQKKQEIHVAEVVRHGDKLILPERMEPESAIDVLHRFIEYEREMIDITETIPVFPWDGALALVAVMEEEFGLVFHQGVQTMFGQGNAREIAVDTGPDGETKRIPWGEFPIPGLVPAGKDKFVTGTGTKDGMLCFELTASVRRKYTALVERIMERVRLHALNNSIYRGKAIRLRFRDRKGNRLAIPEPKFFDTSGASTEDIVYTRELELAIDTNILAPIRYPDACAALGIPGKRGVLLAGPYGTGKTLLAYKIAAEATRNGYTFLYLEDVGELADAINFARQYSPCVIFGEDVDKAAGERTEAFNRILNTLDGIDSKESNIMTVVTTNHLDVVHEAALRPGRFDVVLNVQPPDAEAAGRLVQVYARGLLGDVDLPTIGSTLAGRIPAVIREVVERSKLGYVARTGSSTAVQLTDQDLLSAAYTMEQQNELIQARHRAKPLSEEQRLGSALIETLAWRKQQDAIENAIDNVNDTVGEIHDSVC